MTLTVPDLVILDPSINGMTGGSASQNALVHVLTNNPHGYTLMIRASTSPALQSSSSGAFFPNYTTAVSTTPDYDWSISLSESAFGFTADGPDIVQLYRDNGSICNQPFDWGSPSTCLSPLATTNANISRTDVSNETVGGASTSLEFRAESGAGNAQTSGVYQAPVIITAYMN